MAKPRQKGSEGGQVLARNKKALHDYAIEQHLEAGISLVGSEVKSCREGKISLGEAHVRVIAGEAFLIGAHIAEFGPANQLNHDTTRDRKLLLHRREIDRLEVRLRQAGEAAVPLSMRLKSGRIKVEIGVGRGRRYADRREVVREREMGREMARALKRGRR